MIIDFIPLSTTSVQGESIPPWLPYAIGNILDLKTPEGKNIKVAITKVYPITVSPVMEVQIVTPGTEQKAILKMFDRRAGNFRDKNPYNRVSETAWQSYVRSGQAKSLLDDLDHEDDLVKRARLSGGGGDPKSEEDEYEDDEEEDDGDEVAEEEVMIFHRARKLFTNEVRAYSQLKSLQGRCVPRFIESISLSYPDAPKDLPAIYFRTQGVLLDFIPSFPLSELTIKVPDQPRLWERTVQNSINVARNVNEAGVVHWDCQPRNILVSTDGEFRPFLIDFAQCALKDDYKDTDDLDDENGYKHLVHRVDNHGAIAMIMKQRVASMTAYRINVDPGCSSP